MKTRCYEGAIRELIDTNDAEKYRSVAVDSNFSEVRNFINIYTLLYFFRSFRISSSPNNCIIKTKIEVKGVITRKPAVKAPRILST